MLASSIRCSFSNARVYSNIFLLANGKHTLKADLIPPAYSSSSPPLTLRYCTSLGFSVVETSKRYVKGVKPEFYMLSAQQSYNMACWNISPHAFQLVRNNKVVILTKKEGQPSVRFLFFDRDLSTDEKRKEFQCPQHQFLMLQALIKASIDYGNATRLSQMHKAAKIIQHFDL